MDLLLSPPLPKNYVAYFESLLTVAGVLFGLAFTGLTFSLQSGLTSLKFSRRMFLEVYVHFGRSLLFALAFLTVVPFAILYLDAGSVFLSILYYVFAIAFTKSLLDYYRQLGYIHTVYTTAFVPRHYGPMRTYFRYIGNLGISQSLAVFVLVAVLVGYPIAVSFYEGGSLAITIKGYFYSTLILFAFALLRTTNFIPQFFRLTSQELESQNSTVKRPDVGKVDLSREFSALEDFLRSRSLDEIDPAKTIRFLDGSLNMSFLKNRKGEDAWFNVWVEVHAVSNFEIRDEVCKYAVKMFRLFHESQVDVNSLVLSFHISIAGQTKPRWIFIRASRTEIASALQDGANPTKIVLSLDNILFDELFRDLPITDT